MRNPVGLQFPWSSERRWGARREQQAEVNHSWTKRRTLGPRLYHLIVKSRMSMYVTCMGWLRWHLGPHKAVIFTAVIIAAGFAILWSVLPPNDGLLRANNGFGPDWECTAHPTSEATCIRKLKY
jgi:hypothetical protein